jgi:hypothetical protein
VCGIVTLVKGEVKLSAMRTSRGTPARLAGILMVLALPTALLVSLITSMGMVLAGHPVNVEDRSVWRIMLPVAIMCVMAVLAFVVASKGSSTPR